MSQLEKGNALEEAVHAIERTILASSPRHAEGTFQLEGKKIILANGVRHEVDLYVTASGGHGYESIFIFECKNWEKKVSKNDIIIFSEKIQITNAQWGFFVARCSRSSQI